MDVAALVVSLAAVLISGGALVFAHRADSRADRAERRADELAELEARRFEREEATAEANRRARLVAEFAGVGGSSRGRDFAFVVTNVGQAPARHVSVWVVGEDREAKGAPSGGRKPLMPGQSAPFNVMAPRFEQYSGALVLWYGWTDEAGRHEMASELVFPLT